jgi:hypothetical protein
MLGQRSVVEFDELGRMNLIGAFPDVVALRVALPFDQVLQGLGPPPGPMGTYLLHFVLLFSINQIWWRSGKVRAMRWCFSVRRQQVAVEDRVNVPLRWEFESNCHWGDDLCDFEWAVSSGCEFSSAIW